MSSAQIVVAWNGIPLLGSKYTGDPTLLGTHAPPWNVHFTRCVPVCPGNVAATNSAVAPLASTVPGPLTAALSLAPWYESRIVCTLLRHTQVWRMLSVVPSA